MKKKVSPLLYGGGAIFAIYMIVDRLIVNVSEWLAIPLLLISIVLMMIGLIKMNKKKEN